MNTFRRYGSFILTVALGLFVVLGCRRSRPSYNYNYNSSPRPSATPTVNRTATPYPDTKIDRKTFSMALRAIWKEDTTGANYDPDTFVMFERGTSTNCLFEILIGKKSAGASVDGLLASQRDGWLKIVSEPKVTEFHEWGNYTGKGVEIEGKVQGTFLQQHRIFVFTKGDAVCLVIESAPPKDFFLYSGDFKTIRNSFKLK